MAESGEPAVQQEGEIDTGTEGPSQETSASNSDTDTEAPPQEASASSDDRSSIIGLREEDMSEHEDDYADHEDYYESEADSYGEGDFGTPAEAEQRRFDLELRKQREKDFWKNKTAENISTQTFNKAKHLLYTCGHNKRLRKKLLRLMKGKVIPKTVPKRRTQNDPSTAEGSVPKNTNTADDSSEESDLDMKAFLPHPYPLRHRRLPRGRIRLYQGLTHKNLTPAALNGVFNVIPENLQRSFARSGWIEAVRQYN